MTYGHYFLYVVPALNRTEWHFEIKPDMVPSLLVWTATNIRAKNGKRSGNEWTATYDAVYSCEGCLIDVRIPSSQWKHRDDCQRLNYIPVTPPGNGWRRCSAVPGFIKPQLSAYRRSTVWVRKAVVS